MAQIPFEAWRDSAETIIAFRLKKLLLCGRLRRSDQDDLRQDLLLAVRLKIGMFDPGRAALATFISRVVDSAILMHLRDRGRLKRAAGYTAVSLDPAVEGGGALSPVDHARRLRLGPAELAARADWIARVRSVVASLPVELQEPARLLSRMPEAAAAQEMGVSRRQMANARKAIGAHLRQHGVDER